MAKPYIIDKYGVVVGPKNEQYMLADEDRYGQLAEAMNEAFDAGREHESHCFLDVIGAARRVHESRDDNATTEIPHSTTIDANAAIALAAALEHYDNRE